MGNDQAKGFAFIKNILAAGPEQARTILEQTQLPSLPDLTTTGRVAGVLLSVQPSPRLPLLG